jgi:FMN phosphatase YigB (HAD superfamily)
MIKALIFDCWGTLFTNTQHPHPFAVFANKLGYEISDRKFLKLFEQHIMTNDSSVRDNVASLLSELGVVATPAYVGELTDILLGSIPTQVLYDDTIQTLNRLKKNYRLILLSNTFKEGFANLLKEYPIDDWFELVLLSYQENTIKPNQKLYEKILDKSELDSSEVLMIGDNYHDDVLAANEVGIQAILLDRQGRYHDVKDNKVHSLDELESFLKLNRK